MDNKKLLRFGILTCVWQRHDLTDLVLSHYNGMKERMKDIAGIELFAVGSEGEKSRSICELNGFHYVERPNKPLGAKWNAGLKHMKSFNLDAVIIIGSDDILNDKIIELYVDSLNSGAKLIGIKDLYFFDQPTQRMLHWIGYKGEREGESIGLGRCIHKDYIAHYDWHLWDDHLNAVLDRSMTVRLERIMQKEHYHVLSCLEDGLAPVDIKTDVNIWSFDRFVAENNVVPVEGQDILRRYFESGFVDKVINLNKGKEKRQIRLNKQAMELEAAGNSEGAIKLLHEVLEIDRNFFKSNFNLGLLYARKNEKLKAAQYYLAAYKVKSDDRNIVINLSYLLKELGQQEGAAEILKMFVSSNPDDVEMRNLYASVL